MFENMRVSTNCIVKLIIQISYIDSVPLVCTFKLPGFLVMAYLSEGKFYIGAAISIFTDSTVCPLVASVD